MNDDCCSMSSTTCPGVGYQSATLCLPVTITPYAMNGPAVVRCCGEMQAVQGTNCCTSGTLNGTCEFTLRQTIQIEVPVDFGATVQVGDTYVECGCVDSATVNNCNCQCNC